MLPSPLSVTIGSKTYSLVRINQDNFGSKYLAKDTNTEVSLDIRHQYEKSTVNGQMERHNFDLRKTVFDPSGVKAPEVYQSYTVFRAPRGTLSANLSEVVGGMTAMLDSTTVAALVSWES